ncbi:MAG TPA: class I SAM-dependent methyltransferase [Candidatus Limnocylindrales bacterium]|nr:class I SAM-dependent methyltransferase [Candidatus Limnocylindrales bacterium]
MTSRQTAPADAQPTATSRALARLYDLDLVEDPGDVDLYLELATRTGGPVLELAAGSGRIAVPLALAGHDVTAVDIEPAMIERAFARARAAGRRVSGRLDLIEADLLELDLPDAGTFRLAFIALNSLFLLATRDAQRQAFRTLARHLAPGGLAVVDVWLPEPEDLARFDGRMIFEYERREPETGHEVTKVATARHDPTTAVVDLTAIYEEGPAGGTPIRWIRHDALRLVGADELRAMAEEAGLVVDEIGGDYDLEPIGPGSERAVLIARRPDAGRA